MDAATATLVDAAMSEAFRDATVITVAHRLPALLQTCDRVAVMSEGRVVEEGRPRYYYMLDKFFVLCRFCFSCECFFFKADDQGRWFGFVCTRDL